MPASMHRPKPSRANALVRQGFAGSACVQEDKQGVYLQPACNIFSRLTVGDNAHALQEHTQCFLVTCKVAGNDAVSTVVVIAVSHKAVRQVLAAVTVQQTSQKGVHLWSCTTCACTGKQLLLAHLL